MPRKAREVSSTGVYHVMMRGINRQMIFDDQEDYRAFLRILYWIAHPTTKSGDSANPTCHIYAYALMGNHFHILLRIFDTPADTTDEVHPTLGDIVKKIASAYVRYYNSKNGRDGHLFKERFKSEPCETMEYFKTLMAYIHQNPVNAGLCKAIADYPYTSWNEYMNHGNISRSICCTEQVLKSISLDELKALVASPLDESCHCIEYNEKRKRSVNDKYISDYIEARYGLNHPTLLQSLPVKERNNILQDLIQLGAGVRQLQRLTGIGIFVISSLNSQLAN